MRLPARLAAHPVLTLVLVLAFAGVAAAAVPAFRATESSAFCATCHEMTPYHDAWAAGPHRGVACVDCHVDAGALNHVTHKVTAAKELWIHLTGDPRFPQGTAVVPDVRCLRCHAGIPTQSGGAFSHARHAGAAPCVECHRDTGHKVSLAALDRARILAVSATASVAPASGTATGTTHPATTCFRCHDAAKTACATCHRPSHEARGDCLTCHRPGTAWVFTHPASTACASCHPAPAKHFGPSCASCHSATVAFAKTTYTHTSQACASCHAAPAGHNRVVVCAACHRNAGASWAVTHPASTACASCHRAPANHFGTACASCHRPLVAWRSATFRHPATGGPHTYRSFACVRCHPGGYRTHTCVACHAAGGGD